ncbi:lysostaphin resistance A-like protein [Nocardioides sp.]|uniref:CPBP family intramembrane glutamic endopeptidase n=1 Tax=Nocardioides sp. TaxID=35761 RepID=UPI003D0F51D1
MRIGDLLRTSLWDIFPRDHWQSPADFRRRQAVTVVVVLIGAIVLALSLRIEPGSPSFYPATLVLAAVWAIGGFASGPLHLGRIETGPQTGDRIGDRARRPIVQPIVIGLALSAVFTVGALIVREIPLLEKQVSSVLDFANQGVGPLVLLVTVLNGIAEELFFRGAVYAAVKKHQVAVTAVAYCLTTAATGNIMLTFAALILGVVVGLQRRASGGVLAPILTHLTWSVSMLYVLPAIFG